MKNQQPRKIEVEYHQHSGDDLPSADDSDVTVLRGVVYKMKSRGPRTDP